MKAQRPATLFIAAHGVYTRPPFPQPEILHGERSTLVQIGRRRRLLVFDHGRWRAGGFKNVFNDFYDTQPRGSDAFRSIFREVFGDEYPAEVDPCGFLTGTDLGNLVNTRWNGTRNWSILPAGVAVRVCGSPAKRRPTGRSRYRRCRHRRSSPAPLPVRAGGAPRVPRERHCRHRRSRSDIRWHELRFAVSGSRQDRLLSETSRILKPGGRFAFTTWEVHETGGVRDYRPLL